MNYNKFLKLSLATVLLGTSLSTTAWTMDPPPDDQSRFISNHKHDLEYFFNECVSLPAPKNNLQLAAHQAIAGFVSPEQNPSTYAERKGFRPEVQPIFSKFTPAILDSLDTKAIMNAVTTISAIFDADPYNRLGWDKLLTPQNPNSSLLDKIYYLELRSIVRKKAYNYMELYKFTDAKDQPVDKTQHLILEDISPPLRSFLAIGSWNNNFKIFPTQTSPYWWTLVTYGDKPALNWSSTPTIMGSDFSLSTDLSDFSQNSGNTLTVSLEMNCSEFSKNSLGLPSISLSDFRTYRTQTAYYHEATIKALEDKMRELTYLDPSTIQLKEKLEKEIILLNETLDKKDTWLKMSVSHKLAPASRDVYFSIQVPPAFTKFTIRNLKMDIGGKEIN